MKIDFKIPINRFTNSQYYLDCSITANKRLYFLTGESKQLIKTIDDILWYLYKRKCTIKHLYNDYGIIFKEFNEKELRKYNKTESSIKELLVNLDFKRKNTLISTYSDNGEMTLSEQTSFVDKLFKWKKHNTIICICYNQYLLEYIKKKFDNDCVLYYVNERIVEY